MAMIAKIKRMYFREKLSISEIARRTSLTRNTIKAWLFKPDISTTTRFRATCVDWRDSSAKCAAHGDTPCCAEVNAIACRGHASIV